MLMNSMAKRLVQQNCLQHNIRSIKQKQGSIFSMNTFRRFSAHGFSEESINQFTHDGVYTIQDPQIQPNYLNGKCYLVHDTHQLAYEPDIGKIFNPAICLLSYYAYHSYYAVPFVLSTFGLQFAGLFVSSVIMFNFRSIRGMTIVEMLLDQTKENVTITFMSGNSVVLPVSDIEMKGDEGKVIKVILKGKKRSITAGIEINNERVANRYSNIELIYAICNKNVKKLE
ncbi:UNKNOWN [Stylonychia lemnae]|uniref:Uncharacterized protein n=1 Tax=Stylonychia lemnae TaxID=5949 RepID=A0A078AWD1_STYLE|nr:UNKNOWN [Stylonychia lemnae]|eukprot:CDW86775.1 UNKNOWN [Stylonychia lemnae]